LLSRILVKNARPILTGLSFVLLAACSGASETEGSPLYRRSGDATEPADDESTTIPAASKPSQPTTSQPSGQPTTPPTPPPTTPPPAPANQCQAPKCLGFAGVCGCSAKDSNGSSVSLACQGGKCACVGGAAAIFDGDCASSADAQALFEANCGCQ
jgi:hypothetical protein